MHIPVLKDELIQLLDIKPGGIYADCTGGGGGHAAMLAEKLGDGKLIILDRDPLAVARLKERFAEDRRISVYQANFKDIADLFSNLEIHELDGLYADFGVSNYQLLEGERGFSIRREGILDMRMDPSSGESAKDVVNKYSYEHLGEIFLRYGEEKFYNRIAKEIISRRMIKPINTTTELAIIVKNAVPAKFHKQGVHPATQTFQALRIHVNQELVAIEYLLREAPIFVKKGGRLAFISFHSLEDRLVKDSFVRFASTCTCPPDFPVCVCGKVPSLRIITKKPVTASDKEVKSNPLSRSAKLRVAEKI